METIQQDRHHAAGQTTKQITISLNNRPVTLPDHKATGREIKEAAINQGVPIQIDFVLFEVKGDGILKTVDDDEVVTLHPHQEFRVHALGRADKNHRGG